MFPCQRVRLIFVCGLIWTISAIVVIIFYLPSPSPDSLNHDFGRFASINSFNLVWKTSQIPNLWQNITNYTNFSIGKIQKNWTDETIHGFNRNYFKWWWGLLLLSISLYIAQVIIALFLYFLWVMILIFQFLYPWIFSQNWVHFVNLFWNES
jgi:hypothetical protein